MHQPPQYRRKFGEEFKTSLFLENTCGTKRFERQKHKFLQEKIQTSKQGEGFVCKVTETVQKAKNIVEVGFEYIYEGEGVKLFRKRK